MKLKQTAIFLLILLFSQAVGWWICIASGKSLGTEGAGMIYVLCGLFGMLAAVLIVVVRPWGTYER